MDNGKEAISWDRFVDRRFEDFDEFSEQIHGWDLDFKQLQSGKSPAELLQFGRPDFHATRFHMEQAYHQRGGTLPNAVTVGLIEDGVEAATTPEGELQQDGLLFFPAGSEFSCGSPPQFRGYTLTIADSLIDEVAESTGLQQSMSTLRSNQHLVKRCRQNKIHIVRQRLRHITNEIKQIEKLADESNVVRELEFDLIRQLLTAVASPQEMNKKFLSSRKKMVLQRALDYIEANPGKPIKVLELSRASGAGVRTLEYVFRDYFNVTPKAYLKSRRLIAVRHELRHSLLTKSLISETAGRWGFWHMGQFAADYRQFFGELPSETISGR
jgi:AraC family ethanolamine operon transcriptional activator